MFLTWVVARVGLVGLSSSDLEGGGPLRGWRRGLQEMAYWGNRAFFFCMGVHWVRVKGVQVREEPKSKSTQPRFGRRWATL